MIKDYLKKITESLEEIKTHLIKNNIPINQYTKTEETIIYPKEIKSENSMYLINLGYLEESIPYDRLSPLYSKTLWSIFSNLYISGVKVRSFSLYKFKKDEKDPLAGPLNFMLKNYDRLYITYSVLLNSVAQYKGGQVIINLKDKATDSVNLLLKLLDFLKNNVIEDYTWDEQQKVLTIKNILDINLIRGGWFERAMHMNLPNFFLDANPYQDYIFLSNLKYETNYGRFGEIDGFVIVSNSSPYKKLFILEYKTSKNLGDNELYSFNKKSIFIKNCLQNLFDVKFYMVLPRYKINNTSTSNNNYVFTVCSVDNFVSKLRHDMNGEVV